MNFPKTTIIISVYKDTEAIGFILESLEHQTLPADEIIVSEDGDSSEMRDYIATQKSRFQNLIHLTQKDDGWRKNIAMNNAIKASSNEYLEDGELLKIELQDNDYKRSNLYHSVYSRENAYRGMSIVRKVSSFFKVFGIRKSVNKFLCQIFRLPIDQTNDEATAQILVIIKKNHL